MTLLTFGGGYVLTNKQDDLIFHYVYYTAKLVHIIFPTTSPRTLSFQNICAAFKSPCWTKGWMNNVGDVTCYPIKHPKSSHFCSKILFVPYYQHLRKILSQIQTLNHHSCLLSLDTTKAYIPWEPTIALTLTDYPTLHYSLIVLTCPIMA